LGIKKSRCPQVLHDADITGDKTGTGAHEELLFFK